MTIMKAHLIWLLAAMLAGCASTQTVSPDFIDGSRSAGIVKLGVVVESGLGGVRVLPDDRTTYRAILICKEWGFGSATASQFVENECTAPSAWGGCAKYLFIWTFRCTEQALDLF